MALLSAGLPLLLLVQASGASVAGTVRDEDTGAPIPGATVALTDLNRQTTSDGFGRWVFLEVPSGPQHLRVRAIGRRPRTVSALVPKAGRLTIDLSLRAEAVRLPGVEVHGAVAVPGLDRDTVATDRWISLAAVRHHPLLAEPDVFQALAGGEIALRPESPSGVHIHGGAADQTAYLLDGIPVFNPYHAGGMFSAWNPDLLAAVHLATTLTAGGPHSLSGAVAGVTRTPGQRFTAQGSLSTTQTRMTLDGPLGGGASILAGIRVGYHGLFAPAREASYLAGGSADWMVKLEAPVLRGRLRLLAVASEDDLSADAGSGDGDPNPLRNSFEWESRSVGAEWRRQVGSLTLLVTAWDARAEAEAEWLGEAGSQRLGSARGDQGLWWALERRTGQGVSLIGIRAERSATDYRVDSLGSPPSGGRSARNSVVTAVIAHSFGLPSGFSARVGGDLAAGAGTIRAGPQAELTWRRSDRLSFGARYARTHQFAQSLRNPESVAGNIFLPDLYFGAGSEGVPVARSDLAVLRADHRPSTGVRITLQAYARRFLGLLLAAPRTAEPYSTGAFDTGRGTASGVSVEATMSRAHFGVLAGYGLERLRILPAGAGYVPGHGASHRAEGGIIVLPGGGTSIRLGAVAALGRRATGVVGDFEWEACNLVDGGCEFRGSPRADSALGAVALPAYFRVDLGVRQSVQLRIAGREASVALFGTLTNLLGRRNVLTYSEDPDLGVRAPVEMRPRSPLVVGLDWRF